MWIGWALSTLGVLFLTFDGVIKVMKLAPVIDSFRQLGYPVDLARGIGLLELILLALYLFPRTSILGVVLWTGYLGGAIATHLRMGDPLFSHVLFPVYVAGLLWGGIYLREERLRALLPLRG